MFLFFQHNCTYTKKFAHSLRVDGTQYKFNVTKFIMIRKGGPKIDCHCQKTSLNTFGKTLLFKFRCK